MSTWLEEVCRKDNPPKPVEGVDFIKYGELLGASERVHALVDELIRSIKDTEAGKAFLADYPPQGMGPNSRIKCDDLEWLLGWLDGDGQLTSRLESVVAEIRSKLASSRGFEREMCGAMAYKECEEVYERRAGDAQNPAEPNVAIFKWWIDRCSGRDQYLKVFSRMAQAGTRMPPNTFLTRQLNSWIAEDGRYDSCLSLFETATGVGVIPNGASFDRWLRFCDTPQQVAHVLNTMKKYGLRPLVSMVVTCREHLNRCTSFDDGRIIVTTMLNTGVLCNVDGFNIMMKLCESGRNYVELFQAMINSGVGPNQASFTIFMGRKLLPEDVRVIDTFLSMVVDDNPAFEPIYRTVERWAAALRRAQESRPPIWSG